MYNRVGQRYITADAALENERQRRRDEEERLRQAGISPPVLYPTPSQGPSPFSPAVPFRDIEVVAPGTTPIQQPDQTTPNGPPPAGTPPNGTTPGGVAPGGVTERIQASILKEVGIALLLTSPAWIPILVLPILRARR